MWNCLRYMERFRLSRRYRTDAIFARDAGTLIKKCERQQPPLIEVTSGHFVKCWKYIDKGNAESEE